MSCFIHFTTFLSSNPAKLLFFSLAFTVAEPHAGAGSDQRWCQTVGLPPSFPLCVCLSVSVCRYAASCQCGLCDSPSGGHHSFEKKQQVIALIRPVDQSYSSTRAVVLKDAWARIEAHGRELRHMGAHGAAWTHTDCTHGLID